MSLSLFNIKKELRSQLNKNKTFHNGILRLMMDSHDLRFYSIITILNWSDNMSVIITVY